MNILAFDDTSAIENFYREVNQVLPVGCLYKKPKFRDWTLVVEEWELVEVRGGIYVESNLYYPYWNFKAIVRIGWDNWEHTKRTLEVVLP